jgi:dTDP-4-dehydrorhamnose 3,5-epimerase
MKTMDTNFTGLKILEPIVHGDDRGYFTESFKALHFPHHTFIQDNESKSAKNVLRGLHFQLPPYAQTKLIRVIFGEILDVVVDLRHDSPTFGSPYSIILNDSNKLQLLVPKGFAHGFLVLSDSAVVSYKVDAPYSPEHDRGIVYNDPVLNIKWNNLENVVLSQKDRELPCFDPTAFSRIHW